MTREDHIGEAFHEWFHGVEATGRRRSARFYEDWLKKPKDQMAAWLKDAFEQGYAYSLGAPRKAAPVPQSASEAIAALAHAIDQDNLTSDDYPYLTYPARTRETATAIYDQFIAPLERHYRAMTGEAEDWRVNARDEEARALAAEAARDEALALLKFLRVYVETVANCSYDREVLARIEAALAPAMEKEEG